VVDDAVAQAHAGGQCATFVEVFMDGIAPGEDCARDEDFVADFERTDFFFGERKSEFNHSRNWMRTFHGKRGKKSTPKPLGWSKQAASVEFKLAKKSAGELNVRPSMAV
jgi:hypothetical protein